MSAPVIAVGSVLPCKIIVSTKTVAASEVKRSRLKGAASRNSMMLGKLELYSMKVRKHASSATSIVIWLESVMTSGNISAGVATNNATKMPRASAPEIRAITKLPFQTGQPRFDAAVLFQLVASV